MQWLVYLKSVNWANIIAKKKFTALTQWLENRIFALDLKPNLKWTKLLWSRRNDHFLVQPIQSKNGATTPNGFVSTHNLCWNGLRSGHRLEGSQHHSKDTVSCHTRFEDTQSIDISISGNRKAWGSQCSQTELNWSTLLLPLINADTIRVQLWVNHN